MCASVISVKLVGKKHTLVKIELSVRGEKTAYTISEGAYREIGCPLSADTILPDALAVIEKEGKQIEALKRALKILAYADNNTRTLYRKLLVAGFSKNDASYAVRECVSLGYIDECQQLRRLISVLSERELLGPHRIYKKLLAKQYRPDDILRMIERLSSEGEIDFTRSKTRLIEKHAPRDFEEKRKLLYKYGYENEND